MLDRAVHRHDDRADVGPDGNEIPPTGRSFEVDFCTVARWDNAEIVVEDLFYDVVGMMRQIGLGD